jgi:hypothetical protein
LDLTGELNFDIDLDPHVRLRWVGLGKTKDGGILITKEAQVAGKYSDKAAAILDGNKLSEALALWAGENTVLHTDITRKLLKYRLYILDSQIYGMNSDAVRTGMSLAMEMIDRQQALQEKPDIEKVLDEFNKFRTEFLAEHSPEDLSTYRAHSIEMAVNELFIRVGQAGNSEGPFDKTTRIAPEIIRDWTIKWQPQVWEELPVQLIRS